PRFKEELTDNPRAREQWFTFKSERMRMRVIEWLREEGICVSTPRCSRTSCCVTSICQRWRIRMYLLNRSIICKGVAFKSVHNTACVLNLPDGSRTITQRNGAPNRHV